MNRLWDYPEIWHTNWEHSFLTTCNFQRTSLLLSKVVRVQIEQDNQGHKEMRGHMLWLLLTSDGKKYWSRKAAKTTTYNAFYTSKIKDYVGLLSQNIYQNLKITHADPDRLFLAIAQN